MKALMIFLAMSFTSASFANPALGEADLKDCECKTCLIENGVCIRTQTNGERYVPDKSSSGKSKKNKTKSGAVQG